ncbi:MAG: hypothetical protein HON90_00495 [Halobacteriovoraceae bacterium]|nr:hypothetical protein [Halobacteriovoraceae bacterium]
MKDYRQIMQEIGMEDSKTEKLHIPKTTDLIESINPNALEFLRSAEYVEGKTIENFEKEDQKVFARRILEIGAYRFYPNKHFKNGADISPGETRVVDTDRHPGNELLNKDGEVFHWFPIDFGQELPFTIKMVENVHILMGATQIIENIGAHKIILEKMVKDLGITANISKLQKDLTQFFPNKGKLPRSSMVTYSLLLEVLEKHGFQVDMFYSEFTKGIFQYEAYEEIIRGEKYLSPKKDFTFEVMKKVDEWRSYLLANMNDDIKKKSAKDLILISPLAALRAYENLNFVNKGQVEVRNFLLTLGIESSTVKSLLAKLSNPKTAAELKEFVTEAAKIKKIKRKERLILSSWSNHLRVKNIDVKLFSLPEFITLSTLSGIVKDVAPSTVKMKLKGAYPQHLGAVKSFTTIYGGELIDRVYHGLKNRDPELAIAWFQEFFTLSKHLGLINFAIGSGVYKSLANKYIRSSRKYFKAINMHGISMAIGMTLSDITIRAMDGQSVEEIVDHVISSKNGRELTFGVLAFLAAEGVISQAGGVLSKILPVKGKMNCQNWFAQAGRMGAVFIVASEIDELTREELVDLGVLDEDTYMHLDQQKKKYIKEVENQSKTIENILKQENIDFKKISKLYYGEIFSPTELLSKTCSAMLPYTIRTKTDKEMSYVGKLQAFEKKLSIIQFNTQDKSVEKLIGTFDLKQIFLRKMDRVTNELCHGLREGNLI